MKKTFSVFIFKYRKFCYLDITLCSQEAEQTATSLNSIEWDLCYKKKKKMKFPAVEVVKSRNKGQPETVLSFEGVEN